MTALLFGEVLDLPKLFPPRIVEHRLRQLQPGHLLQEYGKEVVLTNLQVALHLGADLSRQPPLRNISYCGKLKFDEIETL